MKKWAYYNENDSFSAQWLRNLIRAGYIAPGEVDERSIEDVAPDEIATFRQCHFFAGIGGWSLALRLAGWPDDGPECWTGSAPCQPFSAAGHGKGFADERHLWPSWFWLIGQQHPPVIFGEQVASKAGRAWFDVVSSDLEAYGYAVGAVDLCAAGVGAPHIRQRLYFVADAPGVKQRGIWQPRAGDGREQLSNRGHSTIVNLANANQQQRDRSGQSGTRGRGKFANGSSLGNASGAGLEKWRRQPRDDEQKFTAVERTGFQSGGLAKPNGNKHDQERPQEAQGIQGINRPPEFSAGEFGRTGSIVRPGPWDQIEYLPCTDGKARPVESGSFPLAHGVPNRVGRLRGYGNAIVPPLAAEFIKAYMEAM